MRILKMMAMDCLQLLLLTNIFVDSSAFVGISSKAFTTELRADTLDLQSQLAGAKAQYSSTKFSITAQDVAAVKDSANDIKESINDIVVPINDAINDVSESVKSISIDDVSESLKAATESSQISSVAQENLGAMGARVSTHSSQLSSVTKQNMAAIKDSIESLNGSLKDTGVILKDASGSLIDASESLKDGVGKASPAFENILRTFSKSIESLSTSSSATVDLSEFQFKELFSQYGPLFVTIIAILLIGLNNRVKDEEVAVAKAKAVEAAGAAEIAAEGASLAKKLAESVLDDEQAKEAAEAAEIAVLDAELIKVKNTFKKEKEMMEAKLSKLGTENSKATKSTKTALEKADKLEADKAVMKSEIEKLKEELAELNRTVQSLVSTQPLTSIPVSVEVNTKTKNDGEMTAADLLMEEVNTDAESSTESSDMGAEPSTKSSDDNPWGSLKETTLYGKNKGQLTAYLEERNVDVKGMKKAELIQAIFDL